MRTFKTALLLCLMAVVLATLGAAGCGGQSSEEQAATEARIERERDEAAEQARLEEKVKQLESEVKKSKKDSKSSSAPQQSSPSGSDAASDTSGSWPSGTSAWTVILASVDTRAEAEAVANRASNAELGQLGVLFSSNHSSLRPGYWVAYSGVLDKSGARSRQAAARSAGFPEAYARYVSSD